MRTESGRRGRAEEGGAECWRIYVTYFIIVDVGWPCSGVVVLLTCGGGHVAGEVGVEILDAWCWVAAMSVKYFTHAIIAQRCSGVGV